MTHLFLTLLAAYVAIAALMYVLQRYMLYHPKRYIKPPEIYGLNDFGEHFTQAVDGTRLQLWYKSAANHLPTIAYFHGNADHIGGRASIYRALADQGFGVLALSYRGYGKSEGSPTEHGLYHDARAAIEFLTKEKQVDAAHIMLFGESLGTGVAVQMANEYRVAGLILQSPYISVEDRASELYRYIPVKLLIKDKFRSIDKIRSVTAPLLILHGERDSVIPAKHGHKLYEWANQPKQAYFFPDVGHNDFDSALISEHVLTFTRQYVTK
jgi:uncharacterized protein